MHKTAELIIKIIMHGYNNFSCKHCIKHSITEYSDVLIATEAEIECSNGMIRKLFTNL